MTLVGLGNCHEHDTKALFILKENCSSCSVIVHSSSTSSDFLFAPSSPLITSSLICILQLLQVNASAQFCGVAEMVGPVDFDKSVDYWQQDKWSGQFPLKWHIIKDVPNSQFRHIVLENNDNKPVTNSRDTQEVQFQMTIYYK